jgi:acetylornithine/N-succinyldiaminopimelate aminotransferase
VRYGDADALRGAVSEITSAVFLEPTLGEGGVVPPPAGYLRAAREICDATGALLVLDEVQSVGRTGSWFAHQVEGIVPDVITLAKGLAGGLPIGACIGLGRAAGLLQPGDHGSTFGGNPVVCAAALAVLDVIEAEGLIAQSAAVGQQLADGLRACQAPLLAGVRGSGLWLAMLLGEPVAPAAEAAFRDAGFLVNTVGPATLRLAPPLVLSAQQADQFLAAVPGVLNSLPAPGEVIRVTP